MTTQIVDIIIFYKVKRLQKMNAQITLTEAATFLSVSKATLRNWDKEGKLSAFRNPLNSYRMYNIDDLIKLKNSMSGTEAIVMKEDKSSAKRAKEILYKLQSIIRDGDSNSNILSRFDEISKLLFAEFYSEKNLGNPIRTQLLETDAEYANYIQNLYEDALKFYHISAVGNFGKIALAPAVISKCASTFSGGTLQSGGLDARGLAYEEIIEGSFDKSDNQQYFTPYQIVDFIVGMMKPFLKGTVCDPACGTAGFLTKASAIETVKNLVGIEIDARLSWVSEINMATHNASRFEIHCLKNGGSLGAEAKHFDGSIDAILTNPPFGSDYSERSILDDFELGKEHASRRRGILFVEKAFRLLKEGGYVAIILDRGVLNSKSTADARKFILDHFNILAIVDLPDSAFMPYATVSSSILILQKNTAGNSANKTFFAKSEKIGRKCNGDEDVVYYADGTSELNSDLDGILESWNFLLNDVQPKLSENCYVANINENLQGEKELRLDYVFHHPMRKESRITLEKSAYPLKSLMDICNERNETYIPAMDKNGGAILFTGLANIESFTGVSNQTLTPAASLKSAVKRYEKGDILFSKMCPSLRKISLMEFSDGGYASSECTVLTVRKDGNDEYLIAPELLSVLLRSDFVYGQIISLVTGIGRPRISGKDIRMIKIPVPPKEIQAQAVSLMKNSQNAVKQLQEKAAMLEHEATVLRSSSINNIAKMISGESA